MKYHLLESQILHLVYPLFLLFYWSLSSFLLVEEKSLPYKNNILQKHGKSAMQLRNRKITAVRNINQFFFPVYAQFWIVELFYVCFYLTVKFESFKFHSLRFKKDLKFQKTSNLEVCYIAFCHLIISFFCNIFLLLIYNKVNMWLYIYFRW